MHYYNPLKLNDWEIKRFLFVVIAVQIATLASIGIEMAGIHLPLLRELICFIYLTFIPGALILRVLGLHHIGSVQSLLYTIGLSLASLMFVGVLLNTVGPYAGISRPISVVPLIGALTILISVLSIVCYIRDKAVNDEEVIDAEYALSMPAVFLCIIPFLAILGTAAMNYYSVNLPLVLMVLVIAGIVLLVGFDKFIPKEMYPLAIFVVALALVFHNSLISTYINGWDIHKEKYIASLVITGGYWDPSIFNVLNAMLSIVMLAPIYTVVMNVDIVWVYKIIYPFLFALVPLGLYEVFRKQTDEKTSFMSVFFFVSLSVFFTEMLQLARQELAEFFLVLVILLINDRSMDKQKWSLMFIIFSFSLVLSHYGLTYIFIASLVVVWVLLLLSKYLPIKIQGQSDQNKRLSLTIILALIAFCLAWYATMASGNPFLTILVIVEKIKESLLANFLNPKAAQGLDLIMTGGSASALHKVFLYLILFTQGVIMVGIISLLFKKDLLKIGRECFTFSLVMVAILIAGITVPFFASALNTTRLYQIALIFLAIFFVIGWMSVPKLLGKFTKHEGLIMSIAFRSLAIFLAIFLVFNTGLIFEVANDVPMSYSLNKSIDNEVYHYIEVAGANWIVGERNATPIDNTTSEYYLPPVYSDRIRLILLEGQYVDQVTDFPSNPGDLFNDSYVYLGTYNMLNDKVLIATKVGTIYRDAYVNASDFYGNRSRIYINGGSEVYH